MWTSSTDILCQLLNVHVTQKLSILLGKENERFASGVNMCGWSMTRLRFHTTESIVVMSLCLLCDAAGPGI